MKLDDSVESAPTEDEVNEIADSVPDRVDEIDRPEWQGADELYIQIYSPAREVGSGSCGSAHWVDGEYESIGVRDYMF